MLERLKRKRLRSSIPVGNNNDYGFVFYKLINCKFGLLLISLFRSKFSLSFASSSSASPTAAEAEGWGTTTLIFSLVSATHYLAFFAASLKTMVEALPGMHPELARSCFRANS